MAGEDRWHSDAVRSSSCILCGEKGPSEQHHRSGAGMARRAHDHDSLPLCRTCHHERLGMMPKDDRRMFEAAATTIMMTRARMQLGPFERRIPPLPTSGELAVATQEDLF